MYGGSGVSPSGSPSSRRRQRPSPSVLEQLDRTEPLAGAQPPRRSRERFPHAVLSEPLEQQHLRLAAARPPQPEPRGHDTRVVDDDELAGELVRQLGEARCLISPVARS